MTTPSQDPVREALQLALEAMQENWRSDKSDAAILAATAALAEPTSSPVVTTSSVLTDEEKDAIYRRWQGERDNASYADLMDWVEQAVLTKSALAASPARPEAGDAVRRRVDEIERAIACGSMSAAACFTQMRQLIAHPTEAAPAIPEGETLADRLDWLADRQPPGSQAQSDLYAAATIWRKHLKPSLLTQAAPAAVQAETWCGYVAGMIASHLKRPDDEAVIAKIIERRLWALRPNATTPVAFLHKGGGLVKPKDGMPRVGDPDWTPLVTMDTASKGSAVQGVALDVVDAFEAAYNGFHLGHDDFTEWFGKLRAALAASAPVEAVVEPPLEPVYKATAQNGETCYFGTQSGAKIWAGAGGSVERVELRPVPELRVVSEAVQPVGEQKEQA